MSERVRLLLGDCIEAMRTLEPESVDSVVCDPPYAFPGGFMSKRWDDFDGREDVAFGYYLAGLVDGEGHFRVASNERQYAFQLKLRRDDVAILKQAQRFIGHGRLSETEGTGNAHPLTALIVDTKEGCAELCRIFTRFPLRAKKARDFEVWAEAIAEWLNLPRGNRWSGPTDRTRLLALGDRLREGRAYVDPPWSGNRFQDWCREWARECLRVLKPGGHLVAFGAPRAYHRLACGIEDAGFEVRDSLIWAFGSGMPKSLDVSKAIDRKANEWPVFDGIRAHIREWRDRAGLTNAQLNAVVGSARSGCGMARHWTSDEGGQRAIPSKEQWRKLKAALGWPDCEFDAIYDAVKDGADRPVIGRASGSNDAFTFYAQRPAVDGWDITAPATEAARKWQGFGTALKPSYEAAVLARKPLTGTVAETVMRWGTGAINIDGCRVQAPGEQISNHARSMTAAVSKGKYGDSRAQETHQTDGQRLGRWPPNLLHSGEPEVVDLFPETESGTLRPYSRATPQGNAYGRLADEVSFDREGDSGSAARFFPAFPLTPVDEEGARLFYTAKASSAERGEDNTHATVKPVDLMRWLVRLVTPPGGTVLDCFMGSGTTGIAARMEGFNFIGIEREPEYMAIAEQRMGADYGAVPRVVSKPKDDAVQPTLFAAVTSPGRAK